MALFSRWWIRVHPHKAQLLVSGFFFCYFSKLTWFKSWQQHFPDSRVYPEFNEEVIKKILEEQKQKYERFREGMNSEDDIPFIILIFDDIIADQHIRYETLMNEVFFSGRHFFIFCIVCEQDPKGLPPSMRANADFVAVTYQIQERAIESITKDYADTFEDTDTFEALLKENTQDHWMVLIDQSEAHYVPEDVFYKDLAEEEVEPFKIGDKKFW
jgi:hypothetical protein